MMADYNGWADQREEERESLDQIAIGFPLRWSGRLISAALGKASVVTSVVTKPISGSQRWPAT
jgi:hypothetical protein